MTSRARKLLEEALALPKEERLLIAAELQDSVEESDSPEEIEAAWHEEIVKRVQSIEDGTAVLVDGEESSRRIRAKHGW
jgi:putative addiction module component (TIGR02574 family)